MIHVLLRTSPSRSARPLAKRLCSFFRRLTCDFPFAHLSPPVNFRTQFFTQRLDAGPLTRTWSVSPHPFRQ